MTAAGDYAALIRRLDAFPAARLVCCGDLMLDRFVYGSVERVSPEGPIPVVRVERETTMLGGVANVVRNVAALGARADLVAVAGDDEAGRIVAGLIAEEGGVEGRVITDRGRPTTVKTRYLAAGQQLLRADRETLAPLSEGTVEALLAAYDAGLAEAQVVVLSDYAKGVLSDRLLSEAITRARAAGRAVVADPKSRDFSRYAGASLLTPNRRELAEATSLPCDSDDEVVTAARGVIASCGVEAVLTTRSERGMTLVPKDGDPVHLTARAREVYDVSGAGDTVAATLGVALAAGASLAEAARLANLAGGIVVGKVGTAVARADDLRDALHVAEVMTAEAKVVPLNAALERIERWRRRGARIGFTNGCLDLIHPGHVSLLNQARAACDRLVVGLNSDDSVRRMKGPGRPVQSETARATVLASLGMVDLVIVFDEDTPMRLIEAIRPDVLVKGADYSLDQVVGAPFVQSYGGQVLLAELMPGHSTTRTIAKMAQ